MSNRTKIKPRKPKKSRPVKSKVSNNLQPDLGHYWVEKNADTTLVICLEKPFVQWTLKETYIGFETLGHLGTLIIDGLTRTEAEAIAQKGISAVLKPSPNEKFTSADGRESVIPFRVVPG